MGPDREGPSSHNSAERLEWGVQAANVYGGVHFNQAPQQPGGPRRYGVVPSRVDCFQHRAVANELAETVASVLSGLGGVGKTQLAANYAESVADEVDLLIWITATSRQAILADYATIIADLTGYQSTEPEVPAKRFLSHLATLTDRWLVVLDDVQSPADLRDLWPPTTEAGRVLVTTRRRDAAMRGRNRMVIDVDTFSPTESLDFLRHKLSDQPEVLIEAAELAEDLGHLPLALGQAAAYMLDRQISCAEYRERLAAKENSLESLAPELDSLPENQREPVARTWALSVRLANDLTPVGLAKPLLDLASVLDPNGTPGEVFTSEAALEYLGRCTDRPVTAVSARDALGCLHRLSLINHDPQKRHREVRMHALVQRATRDNLFEAQLKVIAHASADALVEIWPEIERDTELSQVLRANSMALQENAESHLWEPDGHVVLFQTAGSLGECGQSTEAVNCLNQIRLSSETHLGPDHPDTLTSRHQLAHWRAMSGDVTTAITELQALLADRTRTLGPDNTDTLHARHNLAYWQAVTGDTATAITELQAVLADLTRILGPDHHATLTARHNLASSRAMSGDVTTAITELQPVLAKQTRILGPDHRTTLNTRIYLAHWQAISGNVTTAITELQALLAKQTRILGPDHPRTLTARHCLASSRAMSGDVTTAITELQALLADHTRILGPDHPDTLITRRSLAHWQEKAQGGDHVG